MAILGIDEVGRGPWAGPLLICACVLHHEISGLTDSKKLTPKRRQQLEPIIQQNSTYAFGWISAQELDHIGLSNALHQAVRTAVQQVKTPFHQIIIDGTINFLKNTPLQNHVTTLKKADLLIPEVSAASILAKVARDRYMTNLASIYPEYHFEKHVGYGTALHRTALETYGPCPEHRFSFRPVFDQLLRKSKESPRTISDQRSRESKVEAFQDYYELEKYHARRAIFPREYPNLEKPLPYFPTTKALGDRAEQKVAEYLQSEGHTILARNWRTKTCEIDLVSIKNDQIYFTEVKYRKTPNHGHPLEAITTTKQKQMQKAAQNFIKFHPHLNHLKPLLSAASVAGKNFTFQDFLILP